MSKAWTNLSEMARVRVAVADTLGQTCADDMIAACPLDRKDAEGNYLTQVCDPLAGDWEALAGKVLHPTATERAAFRVAYRTRIQQRIDENRGAK